VVERGHLAAGATGKSGALVRMHYTNDAESTLAFHRAELVLDAAGLPIVLRRRAPRTAVA